MADWVAPRDVLASLEEHHTQSFAWALSCCGWRVHLAEDILQTSYLKVLEGRAVFSGRSSVKTWFFEVIRRTASDARRSAFLKRWVGLELVQEKLADSRAGPVEALVEGEEASQLTRALSQLPARQREVIHLVFYSGLSIREAGELLGISIGSARTHYERGKKRLSELLREEGA